MSKEDKLKYLKETRYTVYELKVLAAAVDNSVSSYDLRTIFIKHWIETDFIKPEEAPKMFDAVNEMKHTDEEIASMYEMTAGELRHVVEAYSED